MTVTHLTNAQTLTFNCQQIRDVVRTRAHYIMAGCPPDTPIIVELTQKRDEYLKQVGLATYLSQMLGKVAPLSIRFCVLGWPDGRIVDSFDQPKCLVQHYIRKHYHDDLPYAVEAQIGVGHVIAKFL